MVVTAERAKRAGEILRYLESSEPGDTVLFHFAYALEAAEGDESDEDRLPLFVSKRIDEWLKNNPKKGGA